MNEQLVNIEIKDEKYNRLTFKGMGVEWKKTKLLIQLAMDNGFEITITKCEKETEDE